MNGKRSRATGLDRLRGLQDITEANADFMAKDRQRFANLADPKSAPRVVSSPQLFPTPPALAALVVELADIEPGHEVLEPSAGTGNLFAHITASKVTAVEINADLVQCLNDRFADGDHAIICADFLMWQGGPFDRIIMNPPFKRGIDVQHIRHAETLLKPGGKLVAICYAGPKQRAAFEGTATEWIDLPEGSFKSEGTSVSAAIVVIDNPVCQYCRDTLAHPDDPTGQADCGYCGGSFRLK